LPGSPRAVNPSFYVFSETAQKFLIGLTMWPFKQISFSASVSAATLWLLKLLWHTGDR